MIMPDLNDAVTEMTTAALNVMDASLAAAAEVTIVRIRPDGALERYYVVARIEVDGAIVGTSHCTLNRPYSHRQTCRPDACQLDIYSKLEVPADWFSSRELVAA